RSAHVLRHEERRDAAELLALRISPREHQMDARHRLRRAGVDTLDPGMRMRRHHHRAVQHVRQLDVVDVARAAGEEALVLDAPDRLADAVSVHRSLAASRAPSAIAWNLAQITDGCTSGLDVACDEKPQSTLAMTRSGP